MRFQEPRYITVGVQSTIPQYLQNMMWYMIEIMDVPEKDYLQVFRLSSKSDGKQSIVHSQEQPPYQAEHTFSATQTVTQKVYVIDDTTHCTMLLADEY